MSKDKFLITTAIDYTNDVLHIGHAYQKILSDAIARFERLKRGSASVYFLTGTDEHGSKSETAAAEKGLSPKEFVDEIAVGNSEQLDALGVSYDRFIRTTDEDHVKIATEVFSKVKDNGDIYKGTYEGLYCVGCESHKTLSELTEDGKCKLHPTKEIQKLEEENYFFKWSKYEDYILKLLENPYFVKPDGKRREMIAFVKQGLKDLPVSRPKHKVSWGIEVPGDPEQVIYVWFDALINYYTAGSQSGFWDENTEILHVLGKDNSRWHAVLWPAMLKSAGIRIPDYVYVHGFINLEGQKISKSLGNVLRPTDLVADYGLDSVRYYFLKHGPITEDINVSKAHIKEVYNADLAKGLGNTASRIAKLCADSGFAFPIKEPNLKIWEDKIFEPLKDFRVDLVLSNIWKKLSELDKHITDNEPWKIEDKSKLKEVLTFELDSLRTIGNLLLPFLPSTSEKIFNQFNKETIDVSEPLFPRL